MGIFSGLSDFFGLDIGSTAVRVVQLRGRDPNRAVFRYGTISLDQKAINRSEESNISHLSEKIRELLIQSQITTRNVVVGLPTPRIYSTVREFESMAPSDLIKTLKFQIDMIIPHSSQDAKIDWAILDAEVKEAPSREVFICSTPNEFIQQRLEMLENINLNVVVFEPDALALIRAMASANSAQASMMIIDIGFNDTDIVIVFKNQPRLITTVPTGIFHILKALIGNLRVDQTQAQQLLFQVGMQGGDTYKTLTTSVIQTLDNVLIQSRKATSYFYNRYQDSQLSQIILCGDVTYIPGLAEFLSQQLGLAAVIGDAWQNVVCPQPMVGELRSLAAGFTVAAGLAERQVI